MMDSSTSRPESRCRARSDVSSRSTRRLVVEATGGPLSVVSVLSS